MTQRERAAELLEQHGQTFAEEAGISLEDTPSSLWQLLVLSLLLSSRISATLAVQAAREVNRDFRTPRRLADATEHQVWSALDRGDYLRKDRTVTMLRASARHCLDRWKGDLRRLRDAADGVDDLSRQLEEFTGIGPVGAEVFLREVQLVWPQVGPYAGRRGLAEAKRQGLPADVDRLRELVDPDEVPRLMAALIRTGLQQQR